MRHEITEKVGEIDGQEIELRFQMATNGIVCIADANGMPVIMTAAGRVW